MSAIFESSPAWSDGTDSVYRPVQPWLTPEKIGVSIRTQVCEKGLFVLAAVIGAVRWGHEAQRGCGVD